MLSRLHSSDKTEDKKNRECTCVNIKLNNRRDQQPAVVDVECSSHPGICVLDEEGMCTKRENVLHCAQIPLKSPGKTVVHHRDQQNMNCRRSCCESKSSAKNVNPKVHCYKIDLNNSQDTGLIADKQCQTCGPECSPATCSSRSREYFISWDKIRTKVFFFFILAFILWFTIYSALSLTSSL